MKLIEREHFLTLLKDRFDAVAGREGHCVFITGEAGIGKTSLVKEFCANLDRHTKIYRGTCDALFTPRPLAPLYDIAVQLNNDFLPGSNEMADRAGFFARFFKEFSNSDSTIVIVFEDIHWADEATLDFIRFLGRRIAQLPCLFILTYRENDLGGNDALRSLPGQLQACSYSRLQLGPFSKQAVLELAAAKGYNGEDVYSISGGNPFYVNEILASYSKAVPDTIKDAVLATYNMTELATREIWQLMSIMPGRINISYLEKFDPHYFQSIERCINASILIVENEKIFFKHELFRIIIESSLSPLKRLELNKKILALLQDDFEKHQEIERILHHAKNANDYDTIVKYVPIAAKQASALGCHVETSKLYKAAIEYYQGNDPDVLVQFYEQYAYESYLTNQVVNAIIYTGKALKIHQAKTDIEKTAHSLRFLSRLNWLNSNRANAEAFAEQAIEILHDQAASTAKAMALSNMSQLMMLSDQPAAAIAWGEQAIEMAGKLDDKATLSHALNNVGSVQMNNPSFKQKGKELLQLSLATALENNLEEHAARAYSNLSSNAVEMKDYVYAEKIIKEGIEYCEERELDSWRSNMLSVKASLHLEKGEWTSAYSIADNLLKNEFQVPAFNINATTVVALVKMRTTGEDVLHSLLQAKAKATETKELQRILPSLSALLEYEWLSGKTVIETADLDHVASIMNRSIYNAENSRFAYWYRKVRKQTLPLAAMYEGYDITTIKKAQQAAAIWEKMNCPYYQALALSEGNDDDKKKAVHIVHELGAHTVFEKLKQEMRNTGIKGIPRGIRQTTLSNPAQLTIRELDVLHLLKDGLPNKEIAAKLFVSSKTIENHVSSIFFKLDVSSRMKAVQEALRLDIVK